MSAQETGVKKSLLKVHTLCFILDIEELEFMDLARSWAIKRLVHDRQNSANLSVSTKNTPNNIVTDGVSSGDNDEDILEANTSDKYDESNDIDLGSSEESDKPLMLKALSEEESEEFGFDD